MCSKLYYTPEQAEQELRRYSTRVPTAESIRLQAQKNHEKLGFPVSVVGTRVYIPIKSFRAFWGLPQEQEV